MNRFVQSLRFLTTSKKQMSMMKSHQPVLSENLSVETVITNDITKNGGRRKPSANLLYCDLYSRKCKTGGRETKDQRCDQAENNTSGCKCHPDASLAQKLPSDIQIIENSAGNQKAENC